MLVFPHTSAFWDRGEQGWPPPAQLGTEQGTEGFAGLEEPGCERGRAGAQGGSAASWRD